MWGSILAGVVCHDQGVGVLIETSSGSPSESFSGEIVKSAMALEPGSGKFKGPSAAGLPRNHNRPYNRSSQTCYGRSDPDWRQVTTVCRAVAR